MRSWRPSLALCLVALTSGCYVQADGYAWDAEPYPPQQRPEVTQEVTEPEDQWTLTWSDEFDGLEGTGPDTSKWTFDLGGHGWGNDELQHHTDRVDNVAHDGQGHLRIIARRESYQSNAYTSARIKTQGLFSQRYGRFEARLKLPAGQGIWPAFWMLGDNFPTLGWPECGEIDIMEARGHEETRVHGSLHGPGYSGGGALSRAFQGSEEVPFTEDFHVYSVTWSEAEIVFSVDDQPYHTVTPQTLLKGPWVFDQPFFLILNVAVGGHYPGAPDATTPFPTEMVVDWVRVWERSP